MALVASAEGVQDAAVFLRQRSLSDARIWTTMVRWSGCSGLVVLKELASASACSLGPAATIAVIGSAGAAVCAAIGTRPSASCSGETWSACCMAGELVAGLGADGHLCFYAGKKTKQSSAERAGTSGLFLHRGSGAASSRRARCVRALAGTAIARL